MANATLPGTFASSELVRFEESEQTVGHDVGAGTDNGT